MIQRIQSLWLFVAAMLNSALFATKLYSADQPAKPADTAPAPANATPAGNAAVTHMQLLLTNSFPMLLVALIIIILPVIAIFLYKSRKKQRNLIFGAMFANVIFVAVMLMEISGINHSIPTPVNGQYSLFAVAPVLSLVFLVLAVNGVIKDDKLVKSVDRLR